MNGCRTSHFDGDSHQLNGSHVDFEVETFTLTGWKKTSAIGSGKDFNILGKGGAALSYLATEDQLLLNIGASQYFSSTGLISAGTWYHFALQYDGTRFRAFLNNTEIITGDPEGGDTNDSVSLGGTTGGSHTVSMDESAFFNIALELDQIKFLYGNGTPPGYGGIP